MLQSLDTEKYTAAPDPKGSYAFKKKKKIKQFCPKLRSREVLREEVEDS